VYSGILVGRVRRNQVTMVFDLNNHLFESGIRLLQSPHGKNEGGAINTGGVGRFWVEIAFCHPSRRVYFKLMLSWLDLMAFVALSAALALGIRQGTSFALAVVPALVLYVLLAPIVAPLLPNFVLPLLALLLGLSMAYVAQFIPINRISPALEGIIGGIGGFLWGLFLAFTIWVSFPSEYVASTGAVRYPSEQLPVGVRGGIVESSFARPLFDWASSNPVLKAALLPHVRH